MIRVLTHSQETIEHLLETGAYIYRRRYKVEPSRTAPPLPVRCEKCQEYNTHTTDKCTNQTKCGNCSGLHSTKNCTNNQQPPKCSTCQETHPTYNYRCKQRPPPVETKPELVVPLRTHETPSHSEPKKCNHRSTYHYPATSQLHHAHATEYPNVPETSHITTGTTSS